MGIARSTYYDKPKGSADDTAPVDECEPWRRPEELPPRERRELVTHPAQEKTLQTEGDPGRGIGQLFERWFTEPRHLDVVACDSR